MDELANSMK